MVEPVSLGIAAAALLASKFGEGFAKDAGSSSWHAVGRLREAIAGRLGWRIENQTALAVLADDLTSREQAVVAELITAAVRSDAVFASEVERLVAAARQDGAIDSFVAVAYDKATQINIRGDNSGPVNINIG